MQNASLRISKVAHTRQWQLLKSFINLRNLTICSGPFSTAFPPPVFRASYNPFKTVERLVVNDVVLGDIPTLSTWIRAASSPQMPSSRLTHFKLNGGAGGIHTARLFDLLETLSGSPMQFLVLDGLHYAKLDLIDRVAAAFPDLISLTLCYRKSERQKKTRSVIWPYPSWQYAARFARFHSLEAFRWNFDINTCEPLMDILSHFESGFPDDWWYYNHPHGDETFEDRDSIVKVFAAYCPTLDYMAFLTGSISFDGYRVSKGLDGGVRVEADGAAATGDRKTIHDPGVLQSFSWPDFRSVSGSG